MAARVLDGTALAAKLRAELRPRVAAFAAVAGRPPGLGIVLVGEHAASEVYVRHKCRAAAEVGVRADVSRLPGAAELDAVVATVEQMNRSELHDGVLVQSPLPAGLGEGAARIVFDRIDPAKDVDGFSAVNAGRLLQGRPALAPCTPSGILELLDHYAIPLAGARAVVLGRSDIVGRPVALMLLHRHATVTICHSRTRDLKAITSTADVLVAALGRPAFVEPDMIKPGATVVDVGINRATDGSLVARVFPPGSPQREEFARRGWALVGDVHPGVAAVAGALTPVPGGVGPLTVAMLLRNTLVAAEAHWRGQSR